MPDALQQPNLQALVCLISRKKGINIPGHCSQVPMVLIAERGL